LQSAAVSLDKRVVLNSWVGNAQVMAHHTVGCHAVIVTKPGAIKKTTSGKVQRRACRAAFAAGEYSEVMRCPVTLF
jgi:acyl-CoA synthetase (AMP-forming)/AMP-acid ligase II